MKKSFALVELLVVISILLFLCAISFSVFILLDRDYKLNNGADLVMNKLKSAREKTIASEGDDQYGIFLDSTATLNSSRCVLFKGGTFATRDPAFDEVEDIPSVLISNIDIGGGNEIVFEKLTGATNNSGSFSLELSSDSNKNRSIYIGGLGQVGFNPLPLASDADRIKDARHIHFGYFRIIDLSEIITFNFNGGSVVQNIPVADILNGNNLEWEGEINVLGSVQKLSLQTLNGLNNPNMEFCIHRDGQDNNKSLAITISGDSSGNLASFPADGSSSAFSSIYVQNFTQE